MNETKTLATWVASLRYHDIPENVREHARRFILDNFGCQVAGATLPWSQSYYDVIRKTRSGKHYRARIGVESNIHLECGGQA